MKGSVQFISAGDISVGMWVTLGNLRPVKKEIATPSGEKVEIEERDMNPYLKGAPFRVLETPRPLILLENWCKIPNVPPAIIWDTRLADFIEVSENYAKTYRDAVYPVTPPSPFITFTQEEQAALKMFAQNLLRQDVLHQQQSQDASQQLPPSPPSPPSGGQPVEINPDTPPPIIGGDFGPPDFEGGDDSKVPA
jgi:hypothetical protein